MRLGLYVDAVYRVEDRDGHPHVMTDATAYQFLRFATEVGTHFDSFVLFGRGAGPDADTGFDLGPAGRLELAAMPYYPSLR
jgi:hypothetical protein